MCISFHLNGNIRFIIVDYLMTFALSGNRSPEGQKLHAHRGVRVCQAHPVENAQV